MTSTAARAGTARTQRWTGRILSVIVVLFMIFDTVIHLARPAMVVEAFARLGYAPSLALPIGLIELVCVAAYALPRTRTLGAILLTGYLGGAVATQLRAGSPLVSETLFPVYVGVLAWAGLLLRDPRLRALIVPRAGTDAA